MASEAADTCLVALAVAEVVDTYLAVAEVDRRLMALAAAIVLDTAVPTDTPCWVAAIVLDTAVPTDTPCWAAAIAQMVVRVVVTATVAFAMEADRVDIVVLAVDIVT